MTLGASLARVFAEGHVVVADIAGNAVAVLAVGGVGKVRELHVAHGALHGGEHGGVVRAVVAGVFFACGDARVRAIGLPLGRCLFIPAAPRDKGNGARGRNIKNQESHHDAFSLWPR